MGKIGKIAPIPKKYSDVFQTLESSLASKGFTRAPGTKMSFQPMKENDGRYRTGVDKDAVYLRKLRETSEEAYSAEIQRIDETLEVLKEAFPGVDFGAKSQVWSAFSNNEVKVSPVNMSSDSKFFDLDDPEQLLNFAWLRVDRRIAPSLEAYTRGGYADCQYYIADDEAENKLLYSRKKEINKAIVSFEEMTPTKKRQIARLMGLPISENSTEEAVYNMMDSKLKEGEYKEGEFKGRSVIRIFGELTALAEDRLEIKDLVKQAIKHSIYRVGPGGKIMEGAITVAPSEADLVDILSDSKNQQDVFALEKRLNIKKVSAIS